MGSQLCLWRAGFFSAGCRWTEERTGGLLLTAKVRQVVGREAFRFTNSHSQWNVQGTLPHNIIILPGLGTEAHTLPKVQPSSILFIPQSSWIFSASRSRIFSRWSGKTTWRKRSKRKARTTGMDWMKVSGAPAEVTANEEEDRCSVESSVLGLSLLLPNFSNYSIALVLCLHMSNLNPIRTL